MSSSALRWRGLRSSSTPARPSRRRCAGPRSATPVARKSSRRSSAAAVGRSIDHTRCAPAAGAASTYESSSPCAISSPCLSASARVVLGLQRRARGHQPGHALGRAREQLLQPQRPAAAVAQLEVERVGVDAQEALARPVGILAAALEVRREGRGVAVELAREGGAHATPAGSRSSRVKRCFGPSACGNARALELVVGHAGRAYAPAPEPRPDVGEQEARRDGDERRDRQRPDRVVLAHHVGPEEHEDERHRQAADHRADRADLVEAAPVDRQQQRRHRRARGDRERDVGDVGDVEVLGPEREQDRDRRPRPRRPRGRRSAARAPRRSPRLNTLV